jgi:hypothetical protein
VCVELKLSPKFLKSLPRTAESFAFSIPALLSGDEGPSVVVSCAWKCTAGGHHFGTAVGQ